MKHLFWWTVTIAGCLWLSCQELPAQPTAHEADSVLTLMPKLSERECNVTSGTGVTRAICELRFSPTEGTVYIAFRSNGRLLYVVRLTIENGQWVIMWKANQQMTSMAPYSGTSMYYKETKFIPPSTYAMWFYEMENCIGNTSGDITVRDITFYSVDTGGEGVFHCGQFFVFWFRYCFGTYDTQEKAIRLVQERVNEEWLVKHEMLHALGASGFPHDKELFKTCTGREPND